ncbi:hypothetical protein PHISCL_03449 [Aspergillus sclerotialis]|uniref:Uncharacterized protein n=1 Tax=Aspergillus sclerotialis TaxID=2070753 RepID=A0A3A2ZLZ3_9EURO|nr:hypothetical protein PHISCL_03449 [Aspergillus sclerotialis]
MDLPTDLRAILDECGHYSVDDANFALYALTDLEEADLQTICAFIRRTFIQDILQIPESEVDEFIFPAPGWRSLTQKNFGELVEYHIKYLDKGWRDCDGSNKGEVQWYPFGFVIATSKDWQSDGLILVHCEYDSQSDVFKAESCCMQAKDLGLSLTSLRSVDDYFENLRSQFEYKTIS